MTIFCRLFMTIIGFRLGVRLLLSAVFLLLWTAAGWAASPAPGTPIVNRVFVQYRDTYGNPLPQASHSISVPLSAAPLLSLEKTADSDPVAAGAVFNYTLRYENSGNAPATGVSLVDNLPPEVTFQAASGAGNYDAVLHRVTWGIGDLSAGQAGIRTVTVRVAAAPNGTLFTNRASLTATAVAPVSALLITRVGLSSNILLTKRASPATVGPGGVITYNLSYRNLGNAPARAVRISDQLPIGTAYLVDSATPGMNLAGNTLFWDIPEVPPGGQGELSFRVRISPLALTGQQIINVAGISSTEQSGLSNSVTSFVSADARLSMTKEASPFVRAGLDLTYRLTVENSGLVPLTGLVLRDSLPAGVTFVAAGSGGSLTAGGQQVEWLLGRLDPGSKKTVTLVVQVDRTLAQGQIIENIVRATANEVPPEEASARSTVNARTPGTVEFFDLAWQPAFGYRQGDLIRLQVVDLDQNLDAGLAETITVVLEDSKTGDRETVILTETGPNTGIFRGEIQSSQALTQAGDGVISVVQNSRVKATYTDPLDLSPVSEDSALIDPYGIVFDSVTGKPLAGAIATLRYWDNLSHRCDLSSWPVLPPGEINPALTTGADGFFAFPLLYAGDYCFEIKPPAGYVFPSVIPDAQLPPGYTIGNGSRGEKFTLSPGDPPLVRDIPVDPPAGRLTITKSVNKTQAAIGDLIAYSIKITAGGGAPVKRITLTDVMPHGIQYLRGASRYNGAPFADPAARGGRTFAWNLGDLAPGQQMEITYRAVVGPDSMRGDGVNTASAAGQSLDRAVASPTVKARVKITAGILTSRGTILGKVFLDRDGNGVQNQTPKSRKTGKIIEPGISGAVVYLQDGTRVITDKNGKFSLSGVLPGTYVLRLDESSLPPGLVLVPLSNRFLGDGSSQLLELKPGGLIQADFAVKTVQPSPAEKPSPLVTQPAGVVTPTLKGVEGEYLSASSGDQTPGRDTVETAAQVESSLEGETATGQEKEKSGALPLKEGAVRAEGESSSPLHVFAPRQWEEEIKTMNAELAFLSPNEGATGLRDLIRVVFKAPLGTEPTLFLNGEPVDRKNLGRRISWEEGQVQIFEYIGIRLAPGEQNTLRVEIRDNFGIPRGASQIVILAAGAPERIVIRTDHRELPADGISLMRVEVAVQDKRGQTVPYDTHATVSISAGEIMETDADPLTDGFQIALVGGVGSFTLRAPRETGDATITAVWSDRQGEAKVFFMPHLRELFLIGLGEITLGRGQGKGAYGFLKDNAWFDDGFYAGGRGAFFLKGRIFGDFLLTAAFDSEKKRRDDLFRENDTTLDTEEKYPIYGDESKTGYEALSADKLYLKLEKNRSYLLYGDYKTDLNNTTLSAYNRSFNGLKYELNTPLFRLKAFGSHTDQTQVMDIIPGRGISGYYYLTKRPVVEGSERVVIEVRDRYRPENVLSRERKSRGGDYEIDYDLGALLFKEPIGSRDADYNPIFITVSYESRAADEKYYVYGGRGAFRVAPWLEVGATGLQEEKAIGNYRLMGLDLTLNLPRKTVIKAEYAQTNGLFEEDSIFLWRSDQAWLVNLESEPMKKLRFSAYYRTLGNYFQNVSALDVSRGSTKFGFDVVYELRSDTRLRGRFFEEKDDLNLRTHRHLSLGGEARFRKIKLAGEISNESLTEGYVPAAEAPRTPFDIKPELPSELTAARINLEAELRPDLSLIMSHKQNLGGDSYQMSQAGLNYQLNNLNRLYLRQEYYRFRVREEVRTLLGGETKLIRNTVAFNEYRLADGADGSRNQSVLGLRNKFLLGTGITGNISAEYGKTISGATRSQDPDSLAAALGLEYLVLDDLKLTGRLEHRQELSEKGRNSYLAELGAAYKLHPDYSLLIRERFFTEEVGAGGRSISSRTMLGLAYRPLFSNSFNALGKLEYKYEDKAGTALDFREDALIISTEGVWQAAPRLQLTAKYAGKLSREGDFSVYTDLMSARVLYDLTERWDIGAEYRVLTSHGVNSRLQGGAVEIGYRVMKNLWLAAGYSFDRFDADLAGDGYHGEGPYLKLRFKFDEKTWKDLRRHRLISSDS